VSRRAHFPARRARVSVSNLHAVAPSAPALSGRKATHGAVKFCRLVCHCWRRCERYPASHTAAATEVEQKAAAAAAAQIFCILAVRSHPEK